MKNIYLSIIHIKRKQKMTYTAKFSMRDSILTGNYHKKNYSNSKTPNPSTQQIASLLAFTPQTFLLLSINCKFFCFCFY